MFSRIYSITSMAVWADNIKFVKDIIDGKFNKIDQAVAEVRVEKTFKGSGRSSQT